MRLITAVEPVKFKEGDISVFLAGGITDCPEWQCQVIEGLQDAGEDVVVLNPRRRDFPIHAASEQITWEYHALNCADIFSIWFSSGPSVQPICMYELGRHLAKRSRNSIREALNTDGLLAIEKIAIGIEPGYLREQDVRVQTSLVSPILSRRITDSLTAHIAEILSIVDRIRAGR